MKPTVCAARIRRPFVVLGFLAFLLAQHSAVSGADPLRPTPHWIRPAPDGSPEQSAVKVILEKSWEGRPGLLRAIVLLAAEGMTTLSVNGRDAGSASSIVAPGSFDVTRFVRGGSNTLSLAFAPHPATASAALVLELVYDHGLTEWVVSDVSWRRFMGSGAPQDRPSPRADGPFAVSLGKVGEDARGNPFDPKRSVNAYDSWKLALGTRQATTAESLVVPRGFKAELVRSASPEEGSWVCMAFDPQGRLTLARETRGLIRGTLTSNGLASVEVVENTLLECRGLVYAHGSLYANANNSKSFIKLTDRDGDGRFEEMKELLRTEGGVGHGRNHVVLGPDGSLYLVHGNNVVLPPQVAASSPHRRFENDRLIPCPWDDKLFDGDVILPAGHVLRTDQDGKKWEVIAGGFRNPLDVAFHRNGDLFTFDADMEWDLGLPWYRPNRVNHVVSGGEYGWRRGTSKWPDYFPDVVPSTLDIGLASPTAVEFGYAGRFPLRYREALFICDWSYGRIIAVHLRPQGASYIAESELFVSGRPLNVTDLRFGPDGHLYFITGGRGTQSGLYRLRWMGGSPDAETPWKFRLGTDAAENQADGLRVLRRQLEALHSLSPGESKSSAVELIWPSLGHPDKAIRYAARIALEHQNPALWSDRLDSELSGAVVETALLALARVGQASDLPRVLQRISASLTAPPNEKDRLLVLLRALGIALGRNHAALPPPLHDRLSKSLDAMYPASAREANHLLCELLVYLRHPSVLPKTLALLSTASASEDLVHYLFYLRYLPAGWSSEDREEYFRELARAGRLQGANSYQPTLSNLKREMLEKAPETQRSSLERIVSQKARPGKGTEKARSFVKEWSLEELGILPGDLTQRNRERGRTAFSQGQCDLCHRKRPDFADAFVGPDLTGVGGRFGPLDVLDHILTPSKVVDEKYRQIEIVSSDGTSLSGTVAFEDAQRVVIQPFGSEEEERVSVAKSKIEDRRVSVVSPMPEGLLNSLSQEEIWDLVGYLITD